MTLGERICRCRTSRGLSQLDLAERLDVSRQSVSKWETDASVPELDKLVGMCELFQISMDELVRGIVPAAPAPEPSDPQPTVPTRGGMTARVVVGLFLFGLGTLLALLLSFVSGNLLGAFTLSAPFFLCSLICLLAARHTALWCGWAVWLFGMTWVRYATGVHLRFIFHPANYTLHRLSLVMLSIAWGLVLLSCALLFFTGRLWLRRCKDKKEQKNSEP